MIAIGNPKIPREKHQTKIHTAPLAQYSLTTFPLLNAIE